MFGGNPGAMTRADKVREMGRIIHASSFFRCYEIRIGLISQVNAPQIIGLKNCSTVPVTNERLINKYMYGAFILALGLLLFSWLKEFLSSLLRSEERRVGKECR